MKIKSDNTKEVIQTFPEEIKEISKESKDVERSNSISEDESNVRQKVARRGSKDDTSLVSDILDIEVNDYQEIVSESKVNSIELDIEDYDLDLLNQQINSSLDLIQDGSQNLENSIDNSINEITVSDLQDVSEELLLSEKEIADNILSRINESEEYKKLKEEHLHKHSENINEVDFLIYKCVDDNIDFSLKEQLEREIEKVLNVYPEMENVLKPIEEKERQEKNKKQSNIRKAIVDELKPKESINHNPERMGEEVLNSIFSPIKIARKAWLNRSPKSKNNKLSKNTGISVFLGNKIYDLKKYSKDFSKIHLIDPITKEKKEVSNDLSIKISLSKPLILSDLQKSLLAKGKGLVVNSNNTPVKVKLNSEGKFSFMTVSQSNFENYSKRENNLLKKIIKPFNSRSIN